MTIIRDQIHTITTEDITGPQIKTTSGRVYLSKDSLSEQDEIVEIVATVQAVKVPFYGAPIPGTFAIAVTPGEILGQAVDIVSPTTNQTYQLIAINAENLNAAAVAECDIYLTDGSNSVKIAYSGSIAALKNQQLDLSYYPGPIYFTDDVYVSGVPTVGNPNLLQFKLAYCKVVQ